MNGVLCHEKDLGLTLKTFTGSWLAHYFLIAKGICPLTNRCTLSSHWLDGGKVFYWQIREPQQTKLI